VSDYCPAHDYGDPGFPPDECPACKALNAPDMSAELDALREQVRGLKGSLRKAEAYLDEQDVRLPMSAREAAALATIRIALQQGKGEG
jgi:ATP/maltotriose-dependent transcriptional regulator MalT